MIRYTVDVIQALREKGYTSTRIREEKLMGQSYLQQLRHGELVSWATINTICTLLGCQIGDILEFVPDTVEAAEPIPTLETKKDPSKDEPIEG